MTEPGWGAPGFGAPAPRVVYLPARTEGNAIAALVLAVLSFVFCPLLPALVALPLAHEARERIAASGGALQGEGLVSAAVLLAWANIIGILGIGLVFFLVLL